MEEDSIGQDGAPEPASVNLRGISVNDVVWIKPTNQLFGNCLAVVDEVRSWGVQAYVQLPPGGAGYTSFHVRATRRAYVRLPWETIIKLGTMPAEYLKIEEERERNV